MFISSNDKTIYNLSSSISGPQGNNKMTNLTVLNFFLMSFMQKAEEVRRNYVKMTNEFWNNRKHFQTVLGSVLVTLL